MIGTWRKAWGKDFPFYYVQIAPFNYGEKYASAIVREQQTLALSYPKTGMAVITDLVDNIKDIHPKNKHEVGYRLAAWALAETYNKTGFVYKSPMYKSIDVQKGKAVISFNYINAGLVIKGPQITECLIAGADQVFYPAEATVSKGQLIVSSKQVAAPVAVRFGFSNKAIGNLFSIEGLPVNPFRTDDWPIDIKAKDQ